MPQKMIVFCASPIIHEEKPFAMTHPPLLSLAIAEIGTVIESPRARIVRVKTVSTTGDIAGEQSKACRSKGMKFMSSVHDCRYLADDDRFLERTDVSKYSDNEVVNLWETKLHELVDQYPWLPDTPYCGCKSREWLETNAEAIYGSRPWYTPWRRCCEGDEQCPRGSGY